MANTGFENGTNGSAVTTSSEPSVNQVVLNGTASITYDNTHAAHGSLSALFTHNSTNAFYAERYFDGTANATAYTDVYLRFYIYLTANPSASYRIARFENAGADVGWVLITTAGKISLIGATGVTLNTSTASLTLNAWNRIEIHVNSPATGTGFIESRLYLGSNFDGATPDEATGAHSGVSVALGGTSSVRVGQTSGNSVGVDPWIDDFDISHTSWVGAFAGGGGTATVPGAPTAASASAGDTRATVNFTAPVSNGGSPITGYTATSSPGGHTASITGAAAAPITVTGLTNGTSYTFTVHATNSVGDSAESSASNAVTPSTTTGIATNTGFETGTNGNPVTVAASPTLSNVVLSGAATITYDNTQHAHGSQAGKFTHASTSFFFVERNIDGGSGSTAYDDAYLRFYFYAAAAPTANLRIARFVNAGTDVAWVNITAAGKVALVAADGTTLWTSTGALTLNAWNRVEAHVNGSGQFAEAKLFLGANADGATADESSGGHAGTGILAAGTTTIRLGQTTGTNAGIDWWLDDIAMSSTTWVGPYSGTTAGPTANAGSDQTMGAGSQVTLDGSASLNPVGGQLVYAWTHVSGPSTTSALSNPALPKPAYTPLTSGVDVWQLRVTDPAGASSTDTVSVTATNRAPHANAGESQAVAAGATVTLSGAASSDPDLGDTLTYAWTPVSGPNAAGHDTVTTASFSYVASSAGTDIWQLVVTDNHGTASAPATVSVAIGSGVKLRIAGQWNRAQVKTRVSGAWAAV